MLAPCNPQMGFMAELKGVREADIMQSPIKR